MGDRIQSELEYFHQKYGWNIEYKERAQPVMEALPTNNAEEHEQTDIAMEEEEDQTTRSQEDIASEIESVRTDIASKEHEKEELQNDINKAVASEQYEEAGKLAPKKKKLIAETKELKLRLEELEKEIAHKMEEVQEEEEEPPSRSQEEIASEIESVRMDIASKEQEKEDLQNDINKAVASEQYEEAGKLAPKKKKLIAETKELKLRLEELEKEIANKIEELEEEEEPHQYEVDENKEGDSTNDKSAENIDPNEESLHGLNGI